MFNSSKSLYLLSAIAVMTPPALIAQETKPSASQEVPSLDAAGLEQTLKSGKWSVVEFGGPRCIPCKQMQPILFEIQQKLGEKANVRNVYVTEHRDLAKKHKIMIMPTQIVFDPKGKEVLRHTGLWQKNDFLKALEKAGLK